MPRYEIVPATEEHALFVADHMRAADAAEVKALGFDPRPAMLESMRASRDPRAGLVEGVPVLVFGVWVPTLLSDEARPWMLGTEDLPKSGTAVLRRARPVVEEWQDRYSLLRTSLDARNTVAKRWLLWLGFRLSEEPEAYCGPDRVPFYTAWRARLGYGH